MPLLFPGIPQGGGMPRPLFKAMFRHMPGLCFRQASTKESPPFWNSSFLNLKDGIGHNEKWAPA
jgi:hypothetical protein